MPTLTAKATDKSANQANVKPIPTGFHSVTPHLVCLGAIKAIEFYQQAFGANEGVRMLAPDGKLMHGQIRIGDSPVMLAEENPQCCSAGPKALKGTPVTIHLYVADADAFAARAVKAGATVKMPVQDMFWGDRYGVIEDPFGHRWAIATHTRDLTAEQIGEGAKQCLG